jgi:hypothetical protein
MSQCCVHAQACAASARALVAARSRHRLHAGDSELPRLSGAKPKSNLAGALLPLAAAVLAAAQ